MVKVDEVMVFSLMFKGWYFVNRVDV